MKSIVRSLLFVFSLGFIAPACLIRAEPEPYETVTVGYRVSPRCSSNRYWDGYRCARRSYAPVHYYRHHHRWYFRD